MTAKIFLTTGIWYWPLLYIPSSFSVPCLCSRILWKIHHKYLVLMLMRCSPLTEPLLPRFRVQHSNVWISPGGQWLGEIWVPLQSCKLLDTSKMLEKDVKGIAWHMAHYYSFIFGDSEDPEQHMARIETKECEGDRAKKLPALTCIDGKTSLVNTLRDL